MRAHGTYACYVWGPEPGCVPGRGCRCDDCRRAVRDYARRARAQAAPAYVDAEPARVHLLWLRDKGVGLKTVAKRSGVAHGALSKLIYGDPQRGQAPSKRIRKSTEERILAVTPADGATGSRVPAAPTHAHVRRLVAAGVPKRAIAERIGQTGPGLQLGRRFVTRGNARAIAEMAAELDNGTLLVTRGYGRWGYQPVELPQPTARYPGGQSYTDYRYDLRRRQAGLPTVAEAKAADLDQLYDGLADSINARADNWRRRARCRTEPTWLFFPSAGDTETTERALAVCQACPVRARCLDVHAQEPDGIFGGTTPAQRHTTEPAADLSDDEIAEAVLELVRSINQQGVA